MNNCVADGNSRVDTGVDELMGKAPFVPGCPHHMTQRGNLRQETFFCGDDYRRTSWESFAY